MIPRNLDRVEALLRRLAWRAQVPHLVLGVLLLVLGVGVIFLGFALLIRIRSGQLLEAIRAEPPRVSDLHLHTRKISPMGVVDAMSTVFAVIGFASASGGKRTLRLQGKAADLAELTRAIEAACPGVRVDDPETVRVLVV